MNANDRNTDITLSLLQSIAEKSNITQRGLAKRLGLALGLTNNYLKACIKEGLIKIEQIPANKYLYYLTPKGFACKSKLMASHLSASLRVFREAQIECSQFFTHCIRNNFYKIAIIGENDLSEIAFLVANKQFDISVLPSLNSDVRNYDAWIIVDTKNAQKHYDLLVGQTPSERVFCFSVLRVTEKPSLEQL